MRKLGFTLPVMLVVLGLLAVMTPACGPGGKLVIRAVPGQAYVYLDGTPIADASRSGQDDLVLTHVTPGEHTVGVYNYGYKPEVQKVTITDRKITRIYVPLTPEGGTVSGPWGRIQIEGAPHAAVLLNGKTPEFLVGHADEFDNDIIWKQELLVPPGTHQLTVQDRNTTVWSGPVTVAANQRVIVHVKEGGKQVTTKWPRGEKLSNLPRFRAGLASATVAVAPVKTQMSVNPTQVDCGGTARLTWSSTDAVTGQIAGVGDVPASGDREIKPTDTTNYTLTAAGPGGTATASATVNVNKAVQASLNVSPAEVRYERVGDKVAEQGTATVTWSTSNADTVALDPFGSVDASGTRTVQGTPQQTANGPVDQTLTYTLKASNACGGSETRTATLHIAGLIKPAVTSAGVESALSSIYFPTAYPSEQEPGTGLLRSQKTKLTALADAFKKYLEADPNARLSIEGNADTRGSDKYNQALSERRTEIVKQFLVSQGISADKIDSRAFGKGSNLDRDTVKQLEDQDPNKPTAKVLKRRARTAWLAYNRRVDIVLLPGNQRSSRLYPYNADDFKLLWPVAKPARKEVEKAE